MATGCASGTLPTERAVTASAQAAATASALASAPTRPAPLTQPAVSVLVVALGSSADQPGVSPAQPGGVTPQGPTSFAVDDTSIYLWDQANQRVLVYELRPVGSAPGAPKAVPLPEVPARARGLLVVSPTEWYLAEADDTGAVGALDHVRVTTSGVTVSSSRTDLTYPRLRPIPSIFGAAKGASVELGRDALGNRYEAEVILSGAPVDQNKVLRRVRQSDNAVLAVTRRPSAPPVDHYVAPNGGLYELRWNDGPLLQRVEVTQLLAPVSR